MDPFDGLVETVVYESNVLDPIKYANGCDVFGFVVATSCPSTQQIHSTHWKRDKMATIS